MSFLFNLLKRRKTVPVPIAPLASFTCTGSYLTEAFTDTSQAIFGSITKWLWTFGDGNSSTAQNPVYTYQRPGTYPVTLTVTNTAGGSSTTYYLLTVTEDEWVTVNQRDFVLHGRPIRPMGFNEGHFGSWKASDVPYALALGMRFIRFELHWFGDYPVDPVLGAVDMRDDTSPGNLRPAAVAYALQVIKAFTDAGIRVRVAWHSKCMRTGMLTATQADPYCGDTAYWGPKGGNNVWTNPVDRAKFQAAQVFFAGLTRAYNLATFGVDVDILNNPFLWAFEPLNEPQPVGTAVGGNGKIDQAVRDWYAETIGLVAPVRPKTVFITGGAGGYATNKMAAAAQLSIPGVQLAVTADLFNYELTLADGVTMDTVAQKASFNTRIGQVTSVRLAGHAVLLDQVGCNLISDRSRAMFTWLMARMCEEGIAFEQWEIRRPASYDSAFGWIMDDPSNPNGPHLLMAPTDEAAMIATAAYFKLLDGISLN